MTGTTIGFIGLGHMGRPMAANLVRAGRRLLVYDADEEQARSFTSEHGDAATAAHGLDDFAAAEAVVLMLPNAQIVRRVTLENGLLAVLSPGSLLVDMGSSGPYAYDDLLPVAAERNVALVDAPVSGNVDGAAAGTLSIMAGGDDAAVERARPLFDILGGTVFRTGALGSGQAVKALNNLASAGALMLTIEVLLAGQRFGLDPQMVNAVLNASTGRNNATDRKIEPFVLSRQFNSGFGLGLMAKDLRAAGAIIARSATEARLADVVIEIAEAAENELGGRADHTEVAKWFEERTGTILRAGTVSPHR